MLRNRLNEYLSYLAVKTPFMRSGPGPGVGGGGGVFNVNMVIIFYSL